VDFIADLQIPLYVPATVSLMQLMEQFRQAHTHLALVVDEYGELEGLVTMNDVLETVVGDLPSIHADGEDDEIVQREDGSYLVDGMVTLDSFRQYFDVEQSLPGEDTGNIHTLGGVMMFQLGRVPAVTDHFDWQGFSFEVMDMDKTRVDKILISRLPSSLLEQNDS
jgi:putative hemolysin